MAKKKTHPKDIENAEHLRNMSESPLDQITLYDDPVFMGANENLPSPDDILIPSTVGQSLTTSNVVSDLFDQLPVNMSEDELIERNKEATAKVIVDTNQVKFGRKFDEFDRSVLEAVLAQLAAGNRAMTAAMIFRTLSGKPSGKYISKEMLKAVNDSMTKCMYTPVILPFVDPKTKEERTLDSTVLNAIRSQRNIAGNMVCTYEILSIPAIYTYCKAMNAVTFSPIDMVAIPNMSATKRSLAILNALQRAVCPYIWTANGCCMIAEKSEESAELPDVVIPYDDLYALAAVQDKKDDEEQKYDAHGNPKYSWFLMSKARETVTSILDSWVARGYIKSWENTTKVRKICDVRIHLHPITRTFCPLPDMNSGSEERKGPSDQ